MNYVRAIKFNKNKLEDKSEYWFECMFSYIGGKLRERFGERWIDGKVELYDQHGSNFIENKITALITCQLKGEAI